MINGQVGRPKRLFSSVQSDADVQWIVLFRRLGNSASFPLWLPSGRVWLCWVRWVFQLGWTRREPSSIQGWSPLFFFFLPGSLCLWHDPSVYDEHQLLLQREEVWNHQFQVWSDVRRRSWALCKRWPPKWTWPSVNVAAGKRSPNPRRGRWVTRKEDPENKLRTTPRNRRAAKTRLTLLPRRTTSPWTPGVPPSPVTQDSVTLPLSLRGLQSRGTTSLSPHTTRLEKGAGPPASHRRFWRLDSCTSHHSTWASATWKVCWCSGNLMCTRVKVVMQKWHVFVIQHASWTCILIGMKTDTWDKDTTGGT